MTIPFVLMQNNPLDSIGNFLWIFIIIGLSIMYPRMMTQQILLKLDQVYFMVEDLNAKAKKHIAKKIGKDVSKDVKESINHFMEFFAIDPVSLDPYGIVKKIDFINELAEKKFKYFVKQIAPHLDEESKADLVMGLSGAVMLNQIGKIIKHFSELIRKTKNLQYALIMQMQLPMIEKMIKALAKGTEAMTNGWAIGDSIGPLVVAEMIGDSKTKEIADETVACEKTIAGRSVIIIKARGPGGRLGKLGRSVEKIVKSKKISKIMTIDAAAKLEGEKTGLIAEGVGVAIGGPGVDKSYIENLAVQKDIPLDTIIVKMGQEEAIMPMKQEVMSSINNVINLIEKNIKETPGKGSIIIVGVGNSTGIGDNKKAAELAKTKIKKTLEFLKKRGDLEDEKKSGKFNKW